MIYRVFTERREHFRQENLQTLSDFQHMGIDVPGTLRIVKFYDVEGLSEEQFMRTIPLVFADPVKDMWSLEYDALGIREENTVIAIESLPGQFDQRADSARQCVQFVLGGERPEVRTASLYIFSETLAEDVKERVTSALVNPVENRIASLEEVDHIHETEIVEAGIGRIDGFRLMVEGPAYWREQLGLAMEADDLEVVRSYFDSEGREPSITEIRMIDTYWSDHCRHTTFNTELTEIIFDDKLVEASYNDYVRGREALGRTKPISLMDMGTLAAKELKAEGLLVQLDESEEINACTVKVKVTVEETGAQEDWLLLFKNETHNHPTEMEPFGGAATCLGGAIRDPLSGRAYVYQAMRVTGAANPYIPLEETPDGKLTQRRIMQQAAAGYSSYGNQVGVASGLIDEIYHPGYQAKRMECGAVIGAVPAEQVDRQVPQAGDLVLLLGARTGRDGLGGATGSSKSQHSESTETSAAEVQKGNAPEERAIMRLFRKPEISSKIKRCNDFGAGGVSVAIGELAEGLEIYLDQVPLKYSGLDGTEIAISESQERMALVIAPEHQAFFYEEATKENVECTAVAEVTQDARVRMTWRGETIVDLSRAFLDTNGAHKTQTAQVRMPDTIHFPHLWQGSLEESLYPLVEDLNVTSKAGLIQRFDATVGARTVLHPLGGRYQRTPIQTMAARLPRLGGGTDTTSLMAYGYNPFLSQNDEYAGGYLAVVESLAKVIASGGRREEMWLSFQEYFQALGKDKNKWGSPVASVLGAYKAQRDFHVAAIGGKDSMSGSFESIHVPPALISFAVSVTEGKKVLSPEFKSAGNHLLLLYTEHDARFLMDPEKLNALFELGERIVQEERAISGSTSSYGGPIEQIFKGLVGNGLGIRLNDELDISLLFDWHYGSFLFEVTDEEMPTLMAWAEESGVLAENLGILDSEAKIAYQGEVLPLSPLQTAWEAVLEDVYPTQLADDIEPTNLTENWLQLGTSNGKKYKNISILPQGYAKPTALIPVFPGTNTEEESAKAFENAGATSKIVIVRNRRPEDLQETVEAMEEALASSQILFLPGGFSGGDEPDGSGKFINAFLRNERLAASITSLLEERDGLVGGICNGFQGLVKLGLLPYGKIVALNEEDPILDQNLIGRHQAQIIRTRVVQNNSPWLSHYEIGEIHDVAISHGEGQFLCTDACMDKLFKNLQVATQYVNSLGEPSMDLRYNPNSSKGAIEGLVSQDGRVFGRMGHSERMVEGTLKNIGRPVIESKIFKGAVEYFTKA